MYKVDLPRVPSTTAFEDALKAMREGRRSGLLTESHQGEPVLITLKQLLAAVRARKSWKDALDRIQPGEVPFEVSESLTERLDEPAARNALESMFSLRGASQAVAPLSQGEGRLVTQSARAAESLRLAVLVCTCRKNATHVWMYDELVDGKCGFDTEDVDCK